MFKKIDIYNNGKYLCSTNQSRTCKDAITKIKHKESLFVAARGISGIYKDNLTAFFAK